MSNDTKTYAAFTGLERIARGSLDPVVRDAKVRFDAGGNAPILLYDEATGRPVDVDLTGTMEELMEHLAVHPTLGTRGRGVPEHKGPGRPKLGVVSREVSLLPRHWEWLAAQRGGASATLRRLVDEERKRGADAEPTRLAIEAAHRFMWDVGGDLPGFEEASRRLFAADFPAFYDAIAAWPADVVDQLHRFTARATKTER